MSNEKHTPGTWKIGAYDEDLQAVRICAGGFVPLTPAIAMAAGLDKPRAYANARLIAAAPELLAACEVAYNVLKTLEADNYPDTIDMLGKAIAKAKGGAE